MSKSTPTPQRPATVSELQVADAAKRKWKTAKVGSDPRLEVRLASGNDEEAATQLQTLLLDAADGLRRILIAGFFIDRIALDLPHGSLRPWLAKFCPDVHFVTVNRWRELARNVGEAVGLGTTAESRNRDIDLSRILALPSTEVESLPKAQATVRQKVDALIAGKSARQLFFSFKQAEVFEDGTVRTKPGRADGEGGRPNESAMLPSQRLELVQHRASSRMARISNELSSLGSEYQVIDIPHLEAFIAALDRKSKEILSWVNHPSNRVPKLPRA